MNLVTVVPATSNKGLTLRVANTASDLASLNTDVMVYDNGVGISTRLGTGENVGNYGVFHRSARKVKADLILFIHNDLVIHEAGYDRRLIEVFAHDPKLGLVGFIASTEIDFAGGRGLGTRSNYQGAEPNTAPAETHGKRDEGYRAAAVVDGAAMCFRREALLDLPELDYPPHHWYDKLFSLQALERGWHVGFLGIACDHLSGQTANSCKKYHRLARGWCMERGIYRQDHPDAPTREEVLAGERHSEVNWDRQVYLEAEDRGLREYRDEKRFLPLKVGPDHEVYHTHPKGGPVDAAA